MRMISGGLCQKHQGHGHYLLVHPIMLYINVELLLEQLEGWFYEINHKLEEIRMKKILSIIIAFLIVCSFYFYGKAESDIDLGIQSTAGAGDSFGSHTATQAINLNGNS